MLKTHQTQVVAVKWYISGRECKSEKLPVSQVKSEGVVESSVGDNKFYVI
jgi:hypothetical protein